jgi:hypothetical protein
MRIITLVLCPMILAAGAMAACDPNAKVVRSGQQEPKQPGDDNAATGPGSGQGGGSGGSSGDAGLGPFGGSENDSQIGETAGNTMTGDGLPAEPGGDDTSPKDEQPQVSDPDRPVAPVVDGGGAYDGPVRTPLPMRRPLAPGQSGAKATGRCETGDWGVCFSQARPLIAKDPQRAIALYDKACLPGQTKGDGLACQAAALLAESAGQKDRAKRYFDAACTKVDYPVLGACARR